MVRARRKVTLVLHGVCGFDVKGVGGKGSRRTEGGSGTRLNGNWLAGQGGTDWRSARNRWDASGVAREVLRGGALYGRLAELLEKGGGDELEWRAFRTRGSCC